jgi:very-short-patch-repair endonuclease
MSPLDQRLLPLFARQHWLVSQDDVRRAGGSWRQADARVRAGAWERVDRGVYRLVGAPTTWEGRVLAPILSIGGRTVASHACAAALHGIPGFGEGVPEISVERGLGARRADLRLHTSTDLDRTNTVVMRGVPCTSLPRTILDLARAGSDKRILRAIEWGRRTDRTVWTDLASTLARHARRGRPGIRRLRRIILANAHREEVTDSDFELLVLALLREHGLPEPVLHHRVFDGGRFVAEVDLAFPELRIAIELDGSAHLERDVRERDLPRQNDLVLLGWTVLRFTWKRFTERPESVIAEVREAIRRRSRAA